MVIHSSHFEANRAMFGGAIFNFNGDVYIESTTFEDNHAETAGEFHSFRLIFRNSHSAIFHSLDFIICYVFIIIIDHLLCVHHYH